jgi:hypothetical protein
MAIVALLPMGFSTVEQFHYAAVLRLKEWLLHLTGNSSFSSAIVDDMY